MKGFRRSLLPPAFGCAITIVVSLLGLLLGASAHAASMTFTVNTTDTLDDGTCDATHCSLIEAWKASDGNPGNDTIAFAIPGPGPHTIAVGFRLDFFDPAGVVIDGTTQPGWAPGAPVVVIDDTGHSDVDFVIHGAESTVRGLVIHGGGLAIGLEDGGNVVEGNFIGTDATGMTAVPTHAGVFAFGGDNRIGGTTPAARNVIVVSAVSHAVQLRGAGNIVQGNFLGTNASGTEALGSGAVFVVGDRTTLGGAEGTTPGRPCTGACNLIVGGNVFVGDRTSSNSVVQGNFIGTDVNGTKKLGFGALELAGNDSQLKGNVIAGGVAAGFPDFTVAIGGDRNRVEGNRIGTDVTGSEDFGNGGGLVVFGDGNRVGGAAGTMPGGPCTGACNIISGNLFGVSLGGSGGGTTVFSSGNFVQGNYIGTNPAGSADLGNDLFGVAIIGSDNVVGGSAPGEGNVISGNQLDGVSSPLSRSRTRS